MRKHSRFLILLALAAPLATWAQVPVIEGGNGYPPSGYGATGAAYAGGAVTAAPTSAQGELFLQLQQLQEEVARMRGTLEEQQYEIQRLKQESLERYQDLDSRLSSAGQAPAPAAPVAPGASGSQAAAPAAPAAAANGAPGDPAKEKLFYDAAFDLIKAKDFAKADQAFSAFLRKYPTSQYAGNAQYWLGEVKLAQGDLQGAGRAFAQVSQGYPSHQKVADSLYKLADVEQRLGNANKARGILQQVIAQYPGTSAAQLAQRDLARLP
ncbi:tol-pal system protein YbgF [Geopseudomonas sagittaria]|uniref:Cell division coordinator CpoB n=1 Tax=Geopseudomonas sagittaria TaxID=1135990 RepID=A0A1I5VCD5_9GAMM|nr:tol-pal system protein YbgF [Pseudomonas sagittaria]SFQ05169.1 tol-pal system protein YbgF [Pseudomonas sagittaria]